MHQRIVSLVAAVVFALMSVPGVTAQETTPEGSAPTATPPTDWLAEWAPGQTVMIKGATLYYEDHGDPNGQPVLLLHGAWGTPKSSST